MAVHGMALRLGQTLGPPVMGVAFSVWGIDSTFYAAAVVAAAMLVLTTAIIRKRRKNDGD
jgi:predicted MFS family arabinose efflux permease